ncbi:hypothetical protein GCM10009789_83280 [Kribbella sancticallisti]|uniref:Uncharacterized protein n=1 Tax=Kribbella sancticallisti TaxID=460087 RepID=A0ABP4QRM2_9ACTN
MSTEQQRTENRWTDAPQSGKPSTGWCEDGYIHSSKRPASSPESRLCASCIEDGYGRECPVCDRPGGARTSSGFCSRTCEEQAAPLTIQVRGGQLLSSGMEAERLQAAEISDDHALAIASWYQTSGGYGAVFAAFASGCEVEVDQLVDAIGREASITPTADLGQLAAWIHDTTGEPVAEAIAVRLGARDPF